MKRPLRTILSSPAPGGASRPGQVRLEGVAKTAMDMSRNRMLTTGAIFGVAFIAIGWRLLDVSVMQPKLTRARMALPVSAVAARAEIIDRNGVVLATRRPIQSLFADPSLIADAPRLVRRLAGVLPRLNRQDAARRLANRDRRFVWLARDLSEKQVAAVAALDHPGLGFRREWRRTWPHGAVVAHIVGFTDRDGRGLAGIERRFNRRLNEDGKALRLSIDIRVQMALRDVIERTVRRFRAKGGTALMLDIRTGELLGMVSWPDFEPDAPARAPKGARFNRNTLGVYEMGSTFKVFTIALAYQSGLYKAGDRVDARRPIKIRKYKIRDYHAKRRWLTLEEVFIHSSNIGSAKIAIRVGQARFRKFLRKLGLFTTPPVELPEVGAPLYPRRWKPIHTMTVAFGHGMAVSPVQLSAAVGAVAAGLWRPPTLLFRDAAPQARRVVSHETALRMRALMRQVVEKGTGKKADAPGYRVGGKTGTAEKASRRGYRRNRLLSSFVGVFPSDDPRYVVLVTVDEPKGRKDTHGHATGGWVAAPAVQEIILRTAPILGLRPLRNSVEGDGDIPPAGRPAAPGRPGVPSRKPDATPGAASPYNRAETQARPRALPARRQPETFATGRAGGHEAE